MEKLETYQALRLKQLELLAKETTHSKAIESFSSYFKGMSLGDLLTSALSYAIESLESDIECLSIPTEDVVQQEKPRTKKASK